MQCIAGKGFHYWSTFTYLYAVCMKAVSSSDYVVTNGRIVAAEQIGKAVKGSCCDWCSGDIRKN